MMSIEKIERLIPHRVPMRLIDEIVSLDGDSIVCGKTFGPDEFFVQGHFPGSPIVPGVIQCECCLQAGAALLRSIADRADSDQENSDAGSDGSGGVVPVATRIDNVKFKRMIRPGDSVEVHAKLNETISNAFFMTGKVLINGKIATRLDFACSLADPGV